MKCLSCPRKLVGRQRKFCSMNCKNKYWQYNSYISQQERGFARKLDLITLFGGCCQECGYNRNMAVLQFHHKNPLKKKFRLDLRNISNRSWKTVLAEAMKCLLLCANCHTELHNPEFVI